MKIFTKLFRILPLILAGSFFSTTVSSSNLFWIGGTGNWSNTAHWSATSGGTTCSCVPTASDNVYFDANSFTGNAQTVTIDVIANVDSMNWSGITKTSIQLSGTAGTGDLYFSGSLTMNSSMIITNYTANLYFVSALSGNKITSKGKIFSGTVTFDGIGGDWTLQDAFNTSGNMTLTNGSFITNNQNLTCTYFANNASNVCALTLGSSTITITYGGGGAWNTGGSNFALDAGTSLIKFTGTNPSMQGGVNDGFYNILFQNATMTSAGISGGLSFNNVTFPATANSTIYANNGTSFNKVTFNGSGVLNGNAIYDSLIFSAGQTYTLQYNYTQTINSYFQATGTCSLPIMFSSSAAGNQAAISQVSGSATINYVQMKDINATGGATFTANFTSDLGDNTGWNLTASPSDLFWIGGTGNWNEPSHWSATSGGTAACIIPNPSINVHFDANSFSANAQTLTMNVNGYCNSMDWSSLTKTSIQVSGTSDLHISGSLTMKSTMINTNYSGSLYFESTNTGNKITSATKTFTGNIFFNGSGGAGGDWTLQDAFNTTGYITLNYGTWYTNNQSLTCNYFQSNNSNVRGLTLGSSTITITYGGGDAWYTGGSNLSFDAGTSLLKFTGTNPSLGGGTNDAFNDVLFQNATMASAGISGGLSYHNVIFPATATATISPNNGTSFNKVTFNGPGFLNNNAIYDSLIFAAGQTYTLQSTYTQTISNYFQATGTCTLPIFINASTAGTQAIISQSSGSETVNYVQLQDISATGGATFTANFTSDLGDNTGWTINASPKDLYWIGGTGNWNSPSHWSAASGGTAACIIPDPTINVHFDGNSFSGNAQTVTVNVNAYCKSMDWSALTKSSIQLSGTAGGGDFHINGSLTMKSTMIMTNYLGNLYFESVDTGNYITSAGKAFSGSVNFNGNGGNWTLKDAFTTTGTITLNYGNFSTNNKNLNCSTFNSYNSNVRGLMLGSSTMTLSYCCSNAWYSGGNNFALDPGTSLLKFTGTAYPSLNAGTNDGFYDVLFQNVCSSYATVSGGLAFHNITFPSSPAYINANNGTSFHQVIFNGNGFLNNNAAYDSLIFTAGNTYILQSGMTQSISSYFQANGTCTQPIVLHSNSSGTQALITQAGGSATLNYIQLQDISVSGATFIANNTTDGGDNTGWLINSATPVIAGYTSAQSGLSSTFTNTSTGATTYYWIFGDGSSSALTNPVHTYSLGGNYNVYLIASNACGVKDTIIKTVNAGCYPPVANYASNINGLTVTFANSSKNAAKILWNFGDGTSSNSINPVHSYFNSGTYTVCLHISNGCGNDSICNNVTVVCGPPVASYFYSINGMTVNYSNVSNNAATCYWTFGDGQSSSLNSPSHTYNAAGTYNVSLKITDGCGKDSLTQAVSVICAAPLASFVTNPNGLNVDFVSTSEFATSVSWNFGDGSATSILPGVNHIFTATNTYTVCLTATNGCGSNSVCTPVSVCKSPVANFTETSNALNITFTNTSTNGFNYYWHFGDANASNSVSPVHLYYAPDSFQVYLVASNSCGVDTVFKTIDVSCTAFGAPPICMVTVDSLSKNNIIYWDKTPFKSGTGRSAVDSFTVYREVSTNIYRPIKTLAYSDSSLVRDTARTKYGLLANGDPNKATYRYKIQFKDTCGGLSPLSPYHNTIYIVYAGSGQFTWNPGYTIEGGTTPVNNYDLYRDSASTGHWKFVSSCSGTQNTVTDPNFASFPKGSWVVKTSWGIACTPTARLMQSTTVTTSRSNIRNNLPISGIENFDMSASVRIYPNPAKDKLTVEWQEAVASDQPQIAVVNCLGMELMHFTPEKNQLKASLNISNLAAGLYFVEIRGNKYRAVKKVIVQ